jgi:hypothetical protein
VNRWDRRPSRAQIEQQHRGRITRPVPLDGTLRQHLPQPCDHLHELVRHHW